MLEQIIHQNRPDRCHRRLIAIYRRFLEKECVRITSSPGYSDWDIRHRHRNPTFYRPARLHKLDLQRSINQSILLSSNYNTLTVISENGAPFQQPTSPSAGFICRSPAGGGAHHHPRQQRRISHSRFLKADEWVNGGFPKRCGAFRCAGFSLSQPCA